MCGVFGIRSADRDVARVSYFGLFALQHRGQESAGIAVSDDGRLTVLRDLGLVTQVFTEEKLRGLHGQVAIGHTRYSTTGSTHWTNSQPLVHHGRARTVALGHNGNLVNATELREQLAGDGVKLVTTSDTEVIAALIANDPGAARRGRRERDGAGSRARSRSPPSPKGSCIGFRDPHGFRPLVLGRLDGDWVLASETCALDLVGAELEREVGLGELVVIDDDGLQRRAGGARRRTAARSACSSSSTSRGRTRALPASRSHGARVRMGERLAEEAPVEADLVLPIPDSGTPAAIGFARATGIDFSEGLIKNRYVGRTFIQPDQGLREQGVKLKFNPLAEVTGKRVVVGRRLDRARQHDAADRGDAVRRRRRRGARADLVAARSSPSATTGSTSPTRTS